MRRLLVLAATPMELRAVAEGLGVDGPLPHGPGHPPGYALVTEKPVHLALTGVGPLAAAFTAGNLSGKGFLDPEYCRGVILFGIAGTYTPGVAPLGSLVRVTDEIWPEYGLVTEYGVDPVSLGFPLAGGRDDTDPPPVWDRISLAPAALDAMGLYDPATAPRLPENPLVVAGTSITVAGVSGTRARAKTLAAKYTALTENMEGFPLALAAHGAGVPFAELRTVSNIVGDRSPSAWNIPAALAALSRAAALVFA